MDPLSISVGIITLIQATNKVVSFCSNFATTKSPPRRISELLDQLKSLRNILEFLDQYCKSNDLTDPATSALLATITALCDIDNSPIAKELTYLGERLRPPNWASRDGSRRKALVQSLTWPLKEAETTKTLDNIKSLKSDLQLALTANQNAMTMAIQETQKKEFHSLNHSLVSLHNDERYRNILEWLAAPDPSTNFNTALKRRHMDTGLWLLRSQQFRDWKATAGSFLWLHGIPGCGKTVLSSTVVENILQEGPNNNVAYFYFDFNDSTKQYLDKMLRSLIIQLSFNHQSIPEPLLALFNSCQRGARPPQTKDLETLFKALIDLYEKTFIVMDALDECEDRQELLKFVENAIGWKSQKLNVVMTSRKLKELEDFFDAEIGERSRLSIQNEKVDEDIRSYVHGKLQNDTRFERWRGQPKVREEIVTRLMEKSDGMFRWATCQVDALSGCRSLRKLRETLKTLPETLDGTYDRILCQINPLDKREVLHILQWLTCSLRPLSMDEVAEIVAFDVDSDDKFNVENRLANPADVLDMCSSLVISIETDSDDDLEDDETDNTSANSTSRAKVMVRLAHFSVKEYLVSDRIRTSSAASFSIEEKASNARIGTTSLSCLLLYDKALFPSSREFMTEFPLAGYSAMYWHEHLSVKSGTAHLTPLPLATELFLSEEKMRNWIALDDLDLKLEARYNSMYETRQYLVKNLPASPLYYAVLTGLKGLVEALLEAQKDKDGHVGATNDSKLECLDSDYGSATLQYISKDAYVNATGGILHTPLQAASWSGRMDIVECLINNGAAPNIYGGYRSGSALWAAAYKGHLDIVKFLLDRGADVYEGLLADLYEGLLSETSDGSEECRIGGSDAKSLPGEEVDRHTEQDCNSVKVNVEGLAKDEKTYNEVMSPHILKYESRAMNKNKSSALHGAAFSGDAEIARLILDRDERGVLINLRNFAMGETALIAAARNGYDAVVQLLLQRGALVDKTDIYGRTALIMACVYENESIVCKLLDKGADPNFTNEQGEQPLASAIENRYEGIVRILLEKGAFVNADNAYLLVYAVRFCYKDVGKLLVEKGADVNLLQKYGREIPDWLKVYLPPVASLT